MVYEYNLRLQPRDAANEQNIKAYLKRVKGIDADVVRVRRRSIDARQRNIFVNLSLQAFVGEQPETDMVTRIDYHNVDGAPAAIVVGAGPGGLFAALRLIELGMRPIVLERGKDVHSRRKDIALISRQHVVDPESNYSFGEGGAGAFSDGKLYTRSKKRGNTDRILNIFCQHGASTNILVDAHPHIGTDRLPKVIENMRQTIIGCGGEVHFQTKVTGLISKANEVYGVRAVSICDDGSRHEVEFRGPVILATGHSARDVYRWLYADGIEIEAKDLAIGVRLEHPSHLIDQIQYHNREGKGQYLPTAEYSYVTQVAERGVYSFCMCPGGTVVPAASGPEQVVVNGMSASLRNSPWSNSGMVVEIHCSDINHPTLAPSVKADDPLAMLRLQEYLERQCWEQGGKRQTAPAQRMYDFVNRRISVSLPSTSYAPGVVSSPLHQWMPPFITSRLAQGFRHFSSSSRGFLTNEALMIGIETRTSSPVRILRNPDTLSHIRLQGLYPCGEGAGYAGGIVSAAIDGERCAEQLVASYQAHKSH